MYLISVFLALNWNTLGEISGTASVCISGIAGASVLGCFATFYTHDTSFELKEDFSFIGIGIRPCILDLCNLEEWRIQD